MNSIKTNKGRGQRYLQLPSEPYVIVSHHTARHMTTDLQNNFNAEDKKIYLLYIIS